MPSDAEAQELDPTVLVVLEQLWLTYIERPEKPSSVARLSKRSDVPMSVLRRILTHLNAVGLVNFSFDAEGRGPVSLSAEGIELCRALEQDSGAAGEGGEAAVR